MLRFDTLSALTGDAPIVVCHTIHVWAWAMILEGRGSSVLVWSLGACFRVYDAGTGVVRCYETALVKESLLEKPFRSLVSQSVSRVLGLVCFRILYRTSINTCPASTTQVISDATMK